MDISTLFDKNYIIEGIACVKSAIKNGANKVFVLCLDTEVENVFSIIFKNNNVDLISLQEIEKYYNGLEELHKTRKWSSYTDTLKPFFASYLFESLKTIETTLVDCDVYFWGSIYEISKVMSENNVEFMVIDREFDHQKKLFIIIMGLWQ